MLLHQGCFVNIQESHVLLTWEYVKEAVLAKIANALNLSVEQLEQDDTKEVFDLNDKDCFDSNEEYKEYNNDVCDTVNDWLIGNCDDDSIMEYAYDCSDEPIGIMNLIPIINYLKKLDIL